MTETDIRIVCYDNVIVVYDYAEDFPDIIAEIGCDKLNKEKAYEIADLIKEEIESNE